MGANTKGFGSNGQNRSDEERRAFIPPPGYKFGQNDLEGAEAVAVALLCEEGIFRDLIRLKIKPHNFMCIHLFPDLFREYLTKEEIANLTPATLKAQPDYAHIVKLCKKLKKEYDLAKRTVHGANYSMGWKTFLENVLKETGGLVLLTPAEAKAMLAMYFRLFPEVQRYQIRIEQAVKAGLPIVNLFGHQVVAYARFTSALARLAISWGPQSTVGQCSNIAACRALQYIYDSGRKWHLHNITHDSILFSAPAGEIEEASKLFAKFMSFEFTSPMDGWKCSIGVERQIGDNWGKYDEDENPAGLRVVS